MCSVFMIPSIVQLSEWIYKHMVLNEGIVLGKISAYMADAQMSRNKSQGAYSVVTFSPSEEN